MAGFDSVSDHYFAPCSDPDSDLYYHPYFDLYLAYKEGRGVRKNKKSASKYLKLAKENHHLEAASIVE